MRYSARCATGPANTKRSAAMAVMAEAGCRCRRIDPSYGPTER